MFKKKISFFMKQWSENISTWSMNYVHFKHFIIVNDSSLCYSVYSVYSIRSDEKDC